MQAVAETGRQFSVEHDALWTAARIASLLERAAAQADFPARFRTLARPFLEAETPYVRQKSIPSLKQGVLNLRLDRFSCSSFVHLLASLAHAKDYDEFVRTARKIRYGARVGPRYFIHDLLEMMCRMSRCGIVENLGPALARVLNDHREKPRWFSAPDVERIEPQLQCGDVLFFLNAEARIEGAKKITHAGFVYKFDDASPDALFLHAGATERGPGGRRLGCVAIARRCEHHDPAAPPSDHFLRLHEYLATHRRHFSRVTVLRILPAPLLA